MRAAAFIRRFAWSAALVALAAAALVATSVAAADPTPQPLPFSQNWTNTELITTNDDWSGVPGIVGFLGQDMTTVTGTDPQTIVAGASAVPNDVDVIANQMNPNIVFSGGVAEFHITDPVVALQGSGTADAPHIVVHLNTTGFGSVTVSYNLRDVDGGADNAVQPVALQYRVGTTGNFTNVPAGFVADATTGPSLAAQVTPVSATLPADANNQPVVHVRVITTNAAGSDEWVGIDDINVTGSSLGGPQPPVASCPGTVSTLEGRSATTTVTASDLDGTVTDISVTDVTPSPAPSTIARTGFTAAPTPGGTASAEITIGPSVPPGTYTVEMTATNDDAPPQNDSCTFTVAVADLVPIGVVQGVVPDSADGATHASPFVGQRVAVQGIVTERLRNAFFLQNTAAEDDDDPLTSDGIFVFTGAAPPVNVGDEVTVEGTVTEFFSLTELTSPAITPVGSGNALPAVFETSPPSDMEAAEDYWERREAMRARVPATSILLDGRDVFAGGDTEVWVARSDTQIALRVNPYSRRSFRDPHPLDNLAALFDDGNGYRILLGGLWLRDNAGTMLAPTRTFQTLLNAPEGAVYFGFGKYSVQVTEQLVLADGADPAANAPPTPPARPSEYSVSTFNLENLYDYRDDPFDGCDFTGNRGCPGVNPPFDYVPASDEAYRTRLGEIAQQIVADLHAPELILVQEAEDQDICAVAGAALACGATNNADGRPDTLQELALAIAARGGPAYQAALDRDGADDRGIVSGFLYRTDRVELVPPSADDPVLGSSPRVSYRSAALAYNAHAQNPKALNAVLPADVDRSTGTDGSNVFTRPPQVGLFRIWLSAVGGEGGFSELYAVSNHFSSTPDARVGQRTEQARYNAVMAATLQAADAQERIVVGGDLNVFPRPDDPFFSGHPRYPSDQLAALYGQGLVNLYDTLVAEVPTAAYSYVFQGQAQTLDQQFVTPQLRSELRQVRMAHVNSDWPADHPGDGARGVSDHDQVVARFALVVAPRPPLLSPGFRPPARLACRLGATPRALRADRRARVTVSLRAGGAPVDEALVRLRGAGVRAQRRTDLRGIARLLVRPTRAGVIRAVAPASARLRGCSARIGVSTGRPTGRLTGGR